MILSVSRRTDIPSYYSSWFFYRIQEGFVYVRNPMNIHKISRIDISPNVVDCIVFWTKNPLPMLNQLGKIKDYTYYFQFTLTSYSQDIEAGLPKKSTLIDIFKRLSDVIGSNKIIWRYDPILLNDTYTISYHIENFERIAERLKGYAHKCTISFIDFYPKISKNINKLLLASLTLENKDALASALSSIAYKYGFVMDTCAEDIDLTKYGIQHARCIDDKLIESLIGCKLNIEKDKNQRLKCGCVSSIDIGAYDSCKNGCKYCYANYSNSVVEKNFQMHNPESPLLIGDVGSDDIITERKVHSNKNMQSTLFDTWKFSLRGTS